MNHTLVYSRKHNLALCQFRYVDADMRERANKQHNIKLENTKTIVSLFRMQICRTEESQMCTRMADTTPRTRATKIHT